MIEKIYLQVREGEDGLRLDQFLPGVITRFSRRQWRELIASGAVFVNNRRVKKLSAPVHAGEKVTAFIDDSPEESRENKPYHVVHEEARFIVLDKPAGLDTAPTPHSAHDNLHFIAGQEFGNLYLVHRLDRETSGLIIFGRSKKAAALFSELFREARVQKEYLALCSGTAESGEMELVHYLKQMESSNRMRVTSSETGQRAVTVITTRHASNGFSLLSLKPRTGRRHQLRVQLAHENLPIVGDKKYRGMNWQRLMLHAGALRFEIRGRKYEFEVAPDAGFAADTQKIMKDESVLKGGA
jgi:RluA family pseudouridine synthase